jgi:hypothetical protein
LNQYGEVGVSDAPLYALHSLYRLAAAASTSVRFPQPTWWREWFGGTWRLVSSIRPFRPWAVQSKQSRI